MRSAKKRTARMARWLAKEYADYSPAERGRRIRKALGDSAAARSFVQRLLPEFYEDAYGEANSVGGRSVSDQPASLHARSR